MISDESDIEPDILRENINVKSSRILEISNINNETLRIILKKLQVIFSNT